jgi:hypothetical protein
METLTSTILNCGTMSGSSRAPELTAFHAELRIRFSELLELRNPAWEMELGGSGDILWNLSSNRLRHTHDTNVLEHFSTTYEGL